MVAVFSPVPASSPLGEFYVGFGFLILFFFLSQMRAIVIQRGTNTTHEFQANLKNKKLSFSNECFHHLIVLFPIKDFTLFAKFPNEDENKQAKVCNNC